MSFIDLLGKPARKVSVTVGLEQHLIEQLDAVCELHSCSRAEVVRAALVYSLGELDEKPTTSPSTVKKEKKSKPAKKSVQKEVVEEGTDEVTEPEVPKPDTNKDINEAPDDDFDFDFDFDDEDGEEV